MKLPEFKAALTPSTPRGRRLTAGGVILAAALTSSVSILATAPEAPPETHQEKAWPVAVVEARPAAQSPTFGAYGRVESDQVASLRTDLTARVKAVHVREGDWVAAGDVLIELDREQPALTLEERRAELARTRAELRSSESEQDMLQRTLAQARSMNRVAQARLERHRELVDARLISRSLYDEVVSQANSAAIDFETHQQRLADLPNRIAARRAAVERAEALVAQARLTLEKTIVRAPFAGPVLAVHVAPGDHSNLGSSLLEMADAAAFQVRLQVPAHYLPRLRQHMAEGQRIAATLEDGTRLTLARLARRVQPGQSGLDAFFALDAAPDPTALPAIGQVVDVRVALPAEADVVALPVASLYDNDRVYAVEDSRLKAVNVERVGETRTESGEYRVLVRAAELTGGQPVITTQLPKAVPGLLVETT